MTKRQRAIKKILTLSNDKSNEYVERVKKENYKRLVKRLNKLKSDNPVIKKIQVKKVEVIKEVIIKPKEIIIEHEKDIGEISDLKDRVSELENIIAKLEGMVIGIYRKDFKENLKMKLGITLDTCQFYYTRMMQVGMRLDENSEYIESNKITISSKLKSDRY